LGARELQHADGGGAVPARAHDAAGAARPLNAGERGRRGVGHGAGRVPGAGRRALRCAGAAAVARWRRGGGTVAAAE
jgi:hypothetical protein